MSTTATPDEQARAALRKRMAGHVNAAIAACLDGIPDPIERELAARLLIEEVLPEAVKRAKGVRASVVQELRQGGRVKLREVGEQLGGLSPARVDQIARGK